jgi:hypothetical protein
LRALCEAGRIGRVVYILRIRGCGVVECNAPVATRWQWRLGRLHCICAFSLARTHTRPARQGLQSLVANPSVNNISAESLMRTEPELVISGPAACVSPAVANAIGVKAISFPAEPAGSAAAARSCSVGSNCVAPGDRSRQWRVAYPVAAGAVRGLTLRRLPGARVSPLRGCRYETCVCDRSQTHANVSPRALKRRQCQFSLHVRSRMPTGSMFVQLVERLHYFAHHVMRSRTQNCAIPSYFDTLAVQM